MIISSSIGNDERGALAGAAGLVYALYETTIFYFQGFEAGLIAFTAAVMGGIGNLRGAVLGGLIIGVIQQISDASHASSSQSPDPRTGEDDAVWPVTDPVTIGSGWTSGYYVAKPILTNGLSDGQALIPLIYRPIGARHHLKDPRPTLPEHVEAHDPRLGCKSLYVVDAPNGEAARMVSLNRLSRA